MGGWARPGHDKGGLPGANELRSFGLLMGGACGLLALWPLLIRGESPRPWPLGLGLLLAVLGAACPRWLRPLHQVWMWIGGWLGWINTRIILAAGFYALVTPIGIVLRLAGKDPMGRRFGRSETPYRVVRTPRPGSHMFHQY